MSSDIEVWPPPDDPKAFESLCLDLWKEIWGPDSGAQKNGRSGQEQAGVDVFGHVGDRWVGVQSKKKSGLLRSKLTCRELGTEVGKARGFIPSLSRFIVATTGPRDKKVQERAREITASGFPVEVWSWQDIWAEIHGRPAFLKRIAWKYWPTILNVSGRQKIDLGRLPRVSGDLLGRDDLLARLDAAWSYPTTHVVTLVAWGGVGKTALVAEWAARLAVRDYDGADAFDWSFYSQGTRDEGSASGEPFVNAALRFFGGEEGADIAASPLAARDKGAKLAAYVARRKSLLILDGLEPLQYPPSSPLHGELKDPGVVALLKGLAARNPGLCLVTTREEVTDLARFRRSTAPEWRLEGLSVEAGVALLEQLQVKGRRDELEKLVENVDGHALTLQLLGSYLRDAHEGDVRKRDLVGFEEADREIQGGHAFRAIAAYEKWLGEEEERGARQLAILRLLGLFDRPADKGCLDALREEPAIIGLTDAIVGINDASWNLAISALAKCGLASSKADAAIDAHPLIREYFARQFREQHPEAWRAAHGRLFDHLRDSTEKWPDTLEGLQPLYQAVAHGCQAERCEEAYAEIYIGRILRGTETDGFYSTNKLGAFGSDLGALACFFNPPWRLVLPALNRADHAWLLNQTGFSLHALGRLTEALDPIREGVEAATQLEDWRNAARYSSNLSELELTLGDIPSALRDSERSVTFADRSRFELWRMGFRTTYADCLHQAGHRTEALALFHEAERLQIERQPRYPLLYSVWGFRYCDMLLGEVELATVRRGGTVPETAMPEAICEVEERSWTMFKWRVPSDPLLDIALDHLTFGRAMLYRSILEGSDLASARAKIEPAVDGLRQAGFQDYLVRGLLTRAWLLHQESNPSAAQADLEEAQEIAERGPMPLFLADIALMRARLFGDREALAEARRLIEKHGYARRLEELADLEAALG